MAFRHIYCIISMLKLPQNIISNIILSLIVCWWNSQLSYRLLKALSAITDSDMGGECWRTNDLWLVRWIVFNDNNDNVCVLLHVLCCVVFLYVLCCICCVVFCMCCVAYVLLCFVCVVLHVLCCVGRWAPTHNTGHQFRGADVSAVIEIAFKLIKSLQTRLTRFYAWLCSFDSDCGAERLDRWGNLRIFRQGIIFVEF